MSQITVQESQQDSNALVLTISKSSFGEFIRDLISEKKKIRREIKASFVFTRDELLDLITLIDQRVKLQNIVVLSTFAIAVKYRDGYQFELESLEAFTSFRDARQSEVCAIQCEVTYVLRFPGREKPEKQEVSFVIQNLRSFEEAVTNTESLSVARALAFAYLETGAARRDLEYTEVSWGGDLENLITQYLLRKFDKRKFIQAYVRFYALFIAGMFSIIVPFAYGAHMHDKYIQENKILISDKIDAAANLSMMEKALQKIDLLLRSNDVVLSAQQTVSIAIGTAGIILTFATIIVVIAIRRQSFLLMNDFTTELYKRYLRKFEIIRYGLITSFIVGLGASLGAAVLYNSIKHFLQAVSL